jgi:hypothetical protein
MRLHELVEAILAFPSGTAVGTDRYHPRILLRLSPSLLIVLMQLSLSVSFWAGGPRS